MMGPTQAQKNDIRITILGDDHDDLVKLLVRKGVITKKEYDKMSEGREY